jgi:hypothetical protein
MRFLCAPLLAWFALACPVFAKADFIKEEKRVFGGTSCTPKPACLEDPTIPMLMEYGFWVREQRIPPNPKFADDHEMFYSSLYVWYETTSPKDVEEFAFVQYVRGCIYASERHADGLITTHLNVTHQHLGTRSVFVHLDWTVDAHLADPMMSSNPRFPVRHYFMEWNKKPDQFPTEHGAFYGENPPKRPRLFAFDSPGVSAHVPSSSEDFAVNHSLEYRTCLYRTRDIPTGSDGSIIPNALGCFEWKSSYVYDHVTKKYSSPVGIMPACRPSKMPDLKQGW